MTLADGLEIYGSIISTLIIGAGILRYVITSRIRPIEQEIDTLRENCNRIEKNCKEDTKERAEEISELKQALVDEVKDISQGNFEFRLRYESSMSDLKLLLAGNYMSKEDIEKEMVEIRKRIETLHNIQSEIHTIRQALEASQNKQGKK